MQKKQTKDLLIRGIPLEVYEGLEDAAKEHHRSKTQEAIVLIANGLAHFRKLKKPIPYKWKESITPEFIEKAIEEGRE